MKSSLLLICFSLALLSCRTAKTVRGDAPFRLKFLGEYILPDSTVFEGTRVGGLSGIDYDSAANQYYLISDDRSDYNPARFYTAKISLTENGIGGLQSTGVRFLLQPNGAFYPNKTQDSLHVPDPEGIRLNRRTGDLVWVNEGERTVRPTYSILQNPAVHAMRPDGQFVGSFALPKNLQPTAGESGPRRNGVFEGLAFSPDFRWLYVSVEEPLYQDGPRAGQGDSSAWVRILKFDAATQTPVAQFAYRLDPVQRPPIPAGGFTVNGIVDILSLDSNHLLVTERSFSTGYFGCNVRLYRVDLRGAEDVGEAASLENQPPQKPLRKELVLNLDGLGREVYNIEGATFGPRLPNGRRSLLLLSDDNFSGREKTQLLLFEVVE